MKKKKRKEDQKKKERKKRVKHGIEKEGNGKIKKERQRNKREN